MKEGLSTGERFFSEVGDREKSGRFGLRVKKKKKQNGERKIFSKGEQRESFSDGDFMSENRDCLRSLQFRTSSLGQQWCQDMCRMECWMKPKEF